MVDSNSNFYDDVSNKQGVSRRTVAKGALWSVPVVSATVTIPAFAASPDECDTCTINFVHDEQTNPLPYIHGKGSDFPSDVELSAGCNGQPYNGQINITITGDAEFSNGLQTAQLNMVNGIATLGTASSTSGLVVRTKTVLTSTGQTVDFSMDVKNFQITAALDGCEMVTDMVEWVYPNLTSWGINTLSSLGDGTAVASRNKPAAIGPYRVWGKLFGRRSAFALTGSDDNSPNDLFAWSRNDYGQLGLGVTSTRTVPEQVSGKWNEVALGDYHTLFINSAKELYSVGYNQRGQLGLGHINSISVLTRVGTDTWHSVGAADQTSFGIINTSNNLYSWGYDNGGILGNGTPNTDVLSPANVSNLSWDKVVGSLNHAVGVLTNGQLWSWGANNEGQLGTGNNTTSDIPIRVGNAYDPWETVSTENSWTVAKTVNGDIYTWGRGTSGQLGNGTNVTATVIGKIANPNLEWKQAEGSYRHGLAIDINDDLYAWGNNSVGQFGNGTNVSSNVPVKIGKLKWDTIATGIDYSLGTTKTFVPKGYSY
ncbi:MAG: hypothetical protein QM571_00745 [Micrococcaceae bacterium]